MVDSLKWLEINLFNNFIPIIFSVYQLDVYETFKVNFLKPYQTVLQIGSCCSL